MNFRELLESLERRLGNHQLPLNPQARGIKDVFEGSPLHPELMTRMVRAIYAANRCQKLADPVSRHVTLEALGPLRHEALATAGTDVDAWRCIEELCVAVDRAFAAPAAPPPVAAPPRAGAEVVSLEAARRARRLRRAR